MINQPKTIPVNVNRNGVENSGFGVPLTVCVEGPYGNPGNSFKDNSDATVRYFLFCCSDKCLFTAVF